MTNLQNALTDFIRHDLLHGRPVPLDLDYDLLSAGIIDSLGILRVVWFMQTECGVTVADEDLVFENFQSIRSMSRYVEQLQDSTRPQANVM